MVKPKVAYQGIPGAFSDIAIKKYFKNKAKAYSTPNFKAMFKAVVDSKCRYAMVPIENSIAGSILPNYDLLTKHKVYIIGEIYLRISHNLLVVPLRKKIKLNQRLKMIKKVYSHPAALLQCQNFSVNIHGCRLSIIGIQLAVPMMWLKQKKKTKRLLPV